MENTPALDAVTSWLEWLRAGGARPATLGLRETQIRRLARDTGRHPLDLAEPDLVAWLAAHDWAPDTRRSHRAALRSFYRWAIDTDRLAVDPSRRLRPVRPTPTRPRACAEPVLERALAAADDRVQLMIELGARAGLRRAEIAAIHSDDVEPGEEPGRWSLRVHGKGGKIRTVPLRDEIARRLRGLESGYAFPSPAGGHLTPAHVGRLVRDALGTATTHQLRHRYATRIYQQRHDVEEVRALLGHASLATTQRYVTATPQQLRAAVDVV